MRVIVGVILFLGGVVGAYFAIGTVWTQHRRIATFQAAPAVILSSEVDIKRGRKSTSYRPNIRYAYRAGERVRESSRVTAFHETGGSDWAYGIVGRYPATPERRILLERNAAAVEKAPGHAVAYVDPQNPDEAILVREYSFTPYLISLLPVAAAIVGAMMVTGVISGGRTEMMAVAVDASGWKLLLPKVEVRKIYVNRLVTLGACVLVVATLPLHYVGVTDQVRMWPAIFIGGLVIATVISAVGAIRARQVHKRVSDARLRVNQAPAVLGQTLQVAVELDAFAGLQVEGVEVSIVCMETRQSSSKKNQTVTALHLKRTLQVAGSATVSPGQVIEGAGEFAMDRIWQATARGGLPRYAWHVEVKAKLRGVTDYTGEFPLEVVRG